MEGIGRKNLRAVKPARDDASALDDARALASAKKTGSGSE
jgi:hypothetical protein